MQLSSSHTASLTKKNPCQQHAMTKAHEGEQERGNKTPLTKEHNQLYNGKLHNDPKLSAARYHLASDK